MGGYDYRAASKRKILQSPIPCLHPQSGIGDPLDTALDYLRWNTSLPPRLSELAILITARHWTAQYEWYAHHPLAIKAGLDPAVAADIANGQRPNAMKDDEAALY
jgi:4-carboxymuconolactone decarboxylase